MGAGTGARAYAGTLVRRAGDIRYEYDAQGRVVLRQQKHLSSRPSTWRYAWDAEDRLAEVQTPDGARWRYRYDGLGRRIAKERLGADGSTPVARVDFAWDASTLVEHVGHGGRAMVWDCEPTSGRVVGQTERALLRNAPQQWIDQQFYAVVTDIVGTPTELVDQDGNLAWRTRSTLWGLRTGQAAGDADTVLRFPGQHFDAETGLHYNYHRYYDPHIGRYLSADPLGLAAGPDPHAYVANPLHRIDPLGLAPCSPTGTAPGFIVHPNGETDDNRPYRRPDKELVFSGHGGIRVGDTSTVAIPPGTHLHFYVPHSRKFSDARANHVEFYGDLAPVESFGPGQEVPNYYLTPPRRLRVIGTPVTVTRPTRLSQLLRPNQGNVHWAACREEFW
jgi:RHS repeat-associated protein